MEPPALSFRRVAKVFDQARGHSLTALHDVSFDLPAGGKVAIMRRSGSGKSTLLHLAAGIETPTAGEVLVLGRDFARLTEGERTRARRDHIGLVFQFFYLLPHLSVRENVVLPAWIAGDRAAESEARAHELLERVGLAARRDDPVAKLSGGEMQRVALCRALLKRPRLLLADEPTGNLDDENGRLVMELLLRLVDDEGSSLLYVTHSPEMAALADRTWRLHSGILEPS